MWAPLKAIRTFARGASSKVDAPGLSDAVLKRFENDKNLVAAVQRAADKLLGEGSVFKSKYAGLIQGDEIASVAATQKGYLNFYDNDAVQPYIAVAGQGPWIVTATGSVIYDTGGLRVWCLLLVLVVSLTFSCALSESSRWLRHAGVWPQPRGGGQGRGGATGDGQHHDPVVPARRVHGRYPLRDWALPKRLRPAWTICCPV